jgi:hypothetical protein
VFLDKKLRRGVLFAPVCCALLGAGTSQAASFGPQITFEARYDDNVLKTPQPLSDFVTVLIPRLRATEVEGKFPWELRLRRTVAAYRNYPDPLALSDLAMLRGAYYMAAQESVSVGYRYTRSSEPSEVENDAIMTGGDVYANDGRMGIHSWRAEGEVRARSWAYERPGLSDGQAQGWDVRYFPVRTRDTGWLFDYSGENLDLDVRGLTAHTLTTGIRRTHSTWFSSEAAFGGAHVQFDDGSEDESHLAGMVGMVVERGEESAPIRARFRVAHDITTTGVAEIQRSWEVARVTARYESSLDAEGGVYRSPTVSKRAALSTQFSLDGIRRIGVDLSYRKVRPFRVQSESVDADILRFGLSYSTPLKSWLWSRASYDYVRQDVPPGGRAVEFARNRFIVSFVAGVPR